MPITRFKTKRGEKIKEKKKYSYEDYLKLPEDGNRYEILNGGLIMSPSPVIAHQRVSRDVLIQLSLFVKRYNLGEVFNTPCDVILDDNNILQPDIIFVANETKNIITEKNIKGTPDLVMEIISPSTGYYDLIEKKEIYEKFGVKEYWIIDPQKFWIEIYLLKQNKYTIHNRVEKKGKIKSSIISKFEIDTAKLFENL